MAKREAGSDVGELGVVEGIKAYTKELIGAITDNDELQDSGRAEQEQAASRANERAAVAEERAEHGP